MECTPLLNTISDYTLLRVLPILPERVDYAALNKSTTSKAGGSPCWRAGEEHFFLEHPLLADFSTEDPAGCSSF
jgi:hypothetical protein